VSQKQKPLSEAEVSFRGSLRGTRTREHMDATHKHARAAWTPAHPLWGLVWWHQRASEGISASLWGLVWWHQRASEGIRGHQRIAVGPRVGPCAGRT
jgi:hypothetical protein